MRKLCRNYPLAIYPLVSPLTLQGSEALVSVVVKICIPNSNNNLFIHIHIVDLGITCLYPLSTSTVRHSPSTPARFILAWQLHSKISKHDSQHSRAVGFRGESPKLVFSLNFHTIAKEIAWKTLLEELICNAQARKRHININSFVRLVFRFHRICPRDKLGLSLGQIRWKTGTHPGFLLILHSGSLISPGLSLGQTRFVPGTIPGTKGGAESLCEKSLCAFFAR